MAEPNKRQLKLQLRVLHEFCNRYARHANDCGWVTVAGSCTCGYDAQVRRLRDIFELLFADDEFTPADTLSGAPAPEASK